jgi:hypothetical protein
VIKPSTPAPEASGHKFEVVLIVPVNYGEKEEIVLPQILLDAANDRGTVCVPNFLRNNPNCISTLQTQRARRIIRAII